MKRLLIYTATGEFNLGDECILASEIAYLRKRFPEALLEVTTYNPLSTLLPIDPLIRTISYFPNHIRKHPLKNIQAFFQNIISIFHADAIIVGGGGMFYDTEFGQSFDGLRRIWSLRFFSQLVSISLTSISDKSVGGLPIKKQKSVFEMDFLKSF